MKADALIGYWLLAIRPLPIATPLLPFRLPNALGRHLDIGASIDPARPVGGCPFDSIPDHLQYLGLPVGRKGFVARSEIENFSGAASPATSGSEDFASMKP